MPVKNSITSKYMLRNESKIKTFLEKNEKEFIARNTLKRTQKMFLRQKESGSTEEHRNSEKNNGKRIYVSKSK